MSSATKYHVVDSMEEWLAKECIAVETIVLDEPQIPRFKFNIKIAVDQASKRRDLYLSGCAVEGLKKIKDYINHNKIGYKPSGLVKYAFECKDSNHCYKIGDVTKNERLYPSPLDQHVAQAVAMQLFDRKDSLATEAGEKNEKLIYYYLAVLEAVNHPIINHAVQKFKECTQNHVFYDSALVPNCEKPNHDISFYSFYIDVIFFLSLLAPPICVGDRIPTITVRMKTRHNEQFKLFCQKVGITVTESILRGEGWQILLNFLKVNPILGKALVEAVLNPPKLDQPLTVIEQQVIDQVKELWLWTGLSDFRCCYEFAVRADTEAHKIPNIANQCKLVIELYSKLVKTVETEHLVPFTKLLFQDYEFFQQYDVKHYPDLFYATLSKMTTQKVGNTAWEEFAATRPVTLLKREIDEKITQLYFKDMKETKESISKKLQKFKDAVLDEFILEDGTMPKELGSSKKNDNKLQIMEAIEDEDIADKRVTRGGNESKNTLMDSEHVVRTDNREYWDHQLTESEIQFEKDIMADLKNDHFDITDEDREEGNMVQYAKILEDFEVIDCSSLKEL